MILWILIAAAAVTMLWPSAPKQKQDYVPDAAGPTVGVGYIEAVASLQSVRSRLVQTDLLDESVSEALSTLTLALQHGSDQ